MTMTPQSAVRRLIDWQPEAICIRFTGDCPQCESPRLMTYTLPEFIDNPNIYAVYCPACQHHAAGRKSPKQEQLPS